MTEPTATPATAATAARATAGVRALGAGIAAGLAFVVLWSGWTIAHQVDPGGGLGLDAVLGIRGIAGGQRAGQVLAWATGPIAAAIAGWLFAPAAAWHRARNGANMGGLTYVIAIAIAPVAALPAALAPNEFGNAGVMDAVTAVPFLWIASGFVLAPLFFACLVAGRAWAGLLGIARGPVAGPAAARPSILGVVILGSFLAVGWLMGFAVFGWLLSGDAWKGVD